MTVPGQGTAIPTRKLFLLKAAAYAVFLVALWYLLQAGFGLFREGWDRLVERPSTAPRPRLDATGCCWGIYRPEAPLDLKEVHRIEAALGKRASVVSVYQAWGSRAEHRFPNRELTLISNAGYVPMLTWEPWTTEFDESRFGARSERGYRTMRDVGRGVYDDFVRDWARECMRWGRPLFLRFGHEMNNPHYPWSFATGNTPEDFKSAWRRVWDIFQDSGCRNVAWVWTPVAGPGFESYYPGELRVDWVGVAVLNYGLTWPPHHWWEFRSLLQHSYDRLAAFGKPILVPEAASVGESADKGAWHVRALRSLRTSFPRVRLVVFFDAPHDTSHYREGVPWSFSDRPSILSRIKQELESDWFRTVVPTPPR